MPTYQYACRACGHRFEVVQRMIDDPLKVCPECGGELRKVFTPPAITFKGSGFYATDHRTKAKAGGSEDSAASTDKSSEPAKEKKETKPAKSDTQAPGKEGSSS